MLGRIEWIRRLPIKSVILFTGKYALGRQRPNASSPSSCYWHSPYDGVPPFAAVQRLFGGLRAAVSGRAHPFHTYLDLTKKRGRDCISHKVSCSLWHFLWSLMLSLSWFPSCTSSNCQQRINNCCTICPLNFISIIAFFGNFCGE